jgi:hypothetical protein
MPLQAGQSQNVIVLPADIKLTNEIHIRQSHLVRLPAYAANCISPDWNILALGQ